MPYNNGQGGGSVTLEALQVYLTADQVLAGSLAYTVLQMASVDIDTGGWYDPVAFRFTPLIAGNWFFTAQAQFSAAAAIYTGIIRLRKKRCAICSREK